MNAKESGSARPGALGRGLETLMGDEGERATVPEARQPQPEPTGPQAPDQGRSLGAHAGLVGGLIASGAAGALVVATFSLLGVKAVLAMARGMRG